MVTLKVFIYKVPRNQLKVEDHTESKQKMLTQVKSFKKNKIAL